MSKPAHKHQLLKKEEEAMEDGGESKDRRVKRRTEQPSVVPTSASSSSSSSSFSAAASTAVAASAAALPPASSSSSSSSSASMAPVERMDQWVVPASSASASSSSGTAAAATALVPLKKFDVPQKLEECKQTIGPLPFKLDRVQNKGSDFSDAFETLLVHILGEYCGGMFPQVARIVCEFTSLFPIMLLTAFQRDNIVYRPLTALWFTVRTLLCREAHMDVCMDTIKEWVEDTSFMGYITLQENWQSTPDVRARGLDRADRPYSLPELDRALDSDTARGWLTWGAQRVHDFVMTGAKKMDYMVLTGYCYEYEKAETVVDYIHALIGLLTYRRLYRLPFVKFVLLTGIAETKDTADTRRHFANSIALLGEVFAHTFSLGDKQPFVWLFNDFKLSPNQLCRDYLKRSVKGIHLGDMLFKSKRHKLQRRLLRWLKNFAIDGVHTELLEWAQALLQRYPLPLEAVNESAEFEVDEENDDVEYGCHISNWKDPTDTELAMLTEVQLLKAERVAGRCCFCREESDSLLCSYCSGQLRDE